MLASPVKKGSRNASGAHSPGVMTAPRTSVPLVLSRSFTHARPFSTRSARCFLRHVRAAHVRVDVDASAERGLAFGHANDRDRAPPRDPQKHRLSLTSQTYTSRGRLRVRSRLGRARRFLLRGLVAFGVTLGCGLVVRSSLPQIAVIRVAEDDPTSNREETRNDS